MSDLQHEFEQLKATQAIPVHWVLSQGDYEKLDAGNEKSGNHWHCFMESNVVHLCKGFNGLEHFRFTAVPHTEETYLVESIETHDTADFYKEAELKGWSKQEIDQYRIEHDAGSVEEVAGMLLSFFDIKVEG